jgi:hypothetical protein
LVIGDDKLQIEGALLKKLLKKVYKNSKLFSATHYLLISGIPILAAVTTPAAIVQNQTTIGYECFW